MINELKPVGKAQDKPMVKIDNGPSSSYKVNSQAVPIKKEAQENQLPTIKKVVEENQIDSSVRAVKVEEMEFKEEQTDEDMFPMNLNNMNPPPDPSEMKETHKEPDNVEQNREAASA